MGKINQNLFNADEARKTAASATQQPREDAARRIEVRKELMSEVKKTAEILKGMKMPHLAAQVNELAAKAARDRFSVAFVGEFSHGKSTLINRLLDAPVVPVDDLPTTAMLTRICYGPQNEIRITDRAGKVTKTLPLTPESWEGLTAINEDGTKANHANTGFVTVVSDSKWLHSCGIDILDTPGANDGSKERDTEISRALMVTDGAIICLDAQKTIMETQKAFIRDRLLAPKVPFLAIALTHLDLIAPERRERQILFILGQLKQMKMEVPVIVPQDVEIPGESKIKISTGIDGLRSLLAAWSTNPERAERIEKWLAAGVTAIIGMAEDALEEQRRLLMANDEQRLKLLTERKAEISAHHETWEKLRKELEDRCNEVRRDFKRRLDHERNLAVEAMRYRATVVPDPAKWYQQSYQYELGTRMSASIITLDNVVTEKARADFDWLNRELSKRFKTNAERDSRVWAKTEEKSDYVHTDAPELSDISKMQQDSVIRTSAAAAGGALLGSLLFGIGGLIGSAGAGTLTRFLDKRKIDKAIEQDRQALFDYIEQDVTKVIEEATYDSANRIRLLYSDMLSAAHKSESLWLQTQHDLVDRASQPSVEARDKAEAEINSKAETLRKAAESLENLTK